MHYLASSAKPVTSPPHSNQNTISRILETNTYRNFCASDPRVPLTLSIHGSGASDVARSMCQAFEKEPMHGRRIALYFTFDRHDNRRNSVLPMLNSFNARILMASDMQWGKVNRGFDGRFDKRAPFRSWCLFDALQVCSDTSLSLCPVRLGLRQVSALAAASGTGLFVFSPE